MAIRQGWRSGWVFAGMILVCATTWQTAGETDSSYPSHQAPTQKGITMPERNLQNIAELRELFAPILVMPAIQPETKEGRLAGEGLSLPEVEAMMEKALPRVAVERWGTDTLEWIRAVVRPEWLDENLPNCLFAVRRATQGEDAFIGAWTVKGRRFQVVVTMDRVHLLTRTANSQGQSTRDDPAERALAVAYEIMRLPQQPDRSTYLVRQFRGLVWGKHVVPPFARDWHETLQFLTDGRGFKWSVVKYKNRTSVPEAVSPDREPIPWFPE